MATVKLRKSFHYPGDSSGEDDLPNEMDEEEQEKLIKKLKQENDERNEQWKRIFLAIPIIATASYFPSLVTSTLVQAKLLSLLSITSLVATAYILLLVPNTNPESAMHSKDLGPTKQYIARLNAGLSFLLALNALAYKDKTGVHEGFWVLLLLPLTSLTIIVLARRLMLSVDVDELEQLKYRYKGA